MKGHYLSNKSIPDIDLAKHKQQAMVLDPKGIPVGSIFSFTNSYTCFHLILVYRYILKKMYWDRIYPTDDSTSNTLDFSFRTCLVILIMIQYNQNDHSCLISVSLLIKSRATYDGTKKQPIKYV